MGEILREVGMMCATIIVVANLLIWATAHYIGYEERDWSLIFGGLLFFVITVVGLVGLYYAWRI